MPTDTKKSAASILDRDSKIPARRQPSLDLSPEEKPQRPVNDEIGSSTNILTRVETAFPLLQGGNWVRPFITGKKTGAMHTSGSPCSPNTYCVDRVSLKLLRGLHVPASPQALRPMLHDHQPSLAAIGRKYQLRRPGSRRKQKMITSALRHRRERAASTEVEWSRRRLVRPKLPRSFMTRGRL
jgi:hypothetical protein